MADIHIVCDYPYPPANVWRAVTDPDLIPLWTATGQGGRPVGFVPEIPGSDTFDEAQIVDAIARADYDEPVGRERPEAPPPGPPLAHEGGVFRRFIDGFR